MRSLLASRLPTLARIADGTGVEVTVNGQTKLMVPSPRDQLAALDLLAKHGLGDTVAVADVRARMRDQVRIMREELPLDLFERLTARLHEVWQ